MRGVQDADVLVLVAHRLELAGFGSALAVADGAQLSAGTLEHGGLRIRAAEVGVGLASAGSGTARALCALRARGAVLLGSFGAYPGPSALPIGALLVPDEARAIDAAALDGRAAMPDAMGQRAAVDVALASGLAQHAGAGRGTLATTLAITTDDALARRLGERSGCCAENLEAVAVALACAAARVPFASLLACTNEVGARGRAQWLAGHRAAAATTAQAFTAWLAAGAPGLPRA